MHPIILSQCKVLVGSKSGDLGSGHTNLFGLTGVR